MSCLRFTRLLTAAQRLRGPPHRCLCRQPLCLPKGQAPGGLVISSLAPKLLSPGIFCTWPQAALLWGEALSPGPRLIFTPSTAVHRCGWRCPCCLAPRPLPRLLDGPLGLPGRHSRVECALPAAGLGGRRCCVMFSPASWGPQSFSRCYGLNVWVPLNSHIDPQNNGISWWDLCLVTGR